MSSYFFPLIACAIIQAWEDIMFWNQFFSATIQEQLLNRSGGTDIKEHPLFKDKINPHLLLIQWYLLWLFRCLVFQLHYSNLRNFRLLLFMTQDWQNLERSQKIYPYQDSHNLSSKDLIYDMYYQIKHFEYLNQNTKFPVRPFRSG